MSTGRYSIIGLQCIAFLRAYGPVMLLVLAVYLGARTAKQNEIVISSSQEYSLHGLIKAHGFATVDMLGPVPLELPTLVEYLYRGRTILLDDASLFSPKKLGIEIKPTEKQWPSISPVIADWWHDSMYRQLVYNPFTYSEQVRLGEPMPRTSWPALIRLLPPLELSGTHENVLVTEVDGVVYFVPTEWLEVPVAPPLTLFRDKLVEPMLVVLLWIVGWSFTRLTLGATMNVSLSASSALPVGIGLWSVFYWTARSLLGRFFVLGCPGQVFALFVCFFVLPMIGNKTFRADFRRHAALLLFLVIGINILSLGLIRFGSFIPTVDSFRLMSYENSPLASLRQGFPIVLSSISALGVMTGRGFIGTVYPLLFLSLFGSTIAGFSRLESLYPTRRVAKFVAILLTVLFFVLTPMSRLQFSYVNGHVFTACCLLTLLLVLLESRSVRFAPPTAYGHIAYIFFLALFLSMSRMEGALLNVVILVALLFSGLRIGPTSGRLMPAAVASAVLIWGVVTMLILDGQAFVSSSQYVVLSMLATALGLFSLLNPATVAYRWLTVYGARLMLLGPMTVAYAVHVLRPDHMSVSTANIISNLFNQHEGWGYLWWFITGITLIHWAPISSARAQVDSLREGLNQQTQRVLGSFFLLALFAIIAIGIFRQPYRIGWSDSANRIIFQLLPVLLVWLYGKIGSALGTFNQERSLR